MAKKPVPKYDFKAFGAAIKAAQTGRKESRKKVSDEMFISPHYLANIENKGQHPSLQIFFELMLRYNISVDQFLLETPPEKNTQRRQLDALLDGMSDTGITNLYRLPKIRRIGTAEQFFHCVPSALVHLFLRIIIVKDTRRTIAVKVKRHPDYF